MEAGYDDSVSDHIEYNFVTLHFDIAKEQIDGLNNPKGGHLRTSK